MTAAPGRIRWRILHQRIVLGHLSVGRQSRSPIRPVLALVNSRAFGYRHFRRLIGLRKPR
jgi:hypothetical protein